MELQIWSKSEDKRAFILMLRGHEVFLLKVTGISLTLKRKAQGVLDALRQGKDPSDVGAKSVENFDARTISKAEVSPGNGSLTLHGDGDGPKTLAFSTADNSPRGPAGNPGAVRTHLPADAGGDRSDRGPGASRDRRSHLWVVLGGDLPIGH
jgi:hypothetical protein